MENYIQQSEGASLIKHGSFIDLASCANWYLQNVFIYKISSLIESYEVS
jgi:hypothetical protein